MPFIIHNDCLSLLFGRGDVSMSVAIAENNENSNLASVVTFIITKEPQKINTDVKEDNLTDHKFCMVFEKTESIDVLIRQLRFAKKKVIEMQKAMKTEAQPEEVSGDE
jgi:hypothetical protein